MPTIDIIGLVITYIAGIAAAALYFIFEWMDHDLYITQSDFAAAIICGLFWPITYIPHVYRRK